MTACVIAVAAVSLAVPPGQACAAATLTVEPAPDEDTYSPRRLTQRLSEATFTWIWGPNGAGTDELHDVEQDAGLFDSGAPQREGSFEVRASAGSFPYFCSIHYAMRALVAVRPDAGPGYPRPFRVRWATQESETGRRFEVRFQVGKGPWDRWLRDTERRSAVFGRRGQPAEIHDGDRYRFRVRTLRTKRKRSDWSPPLVVGP